jgi:hypothetical protein
LYGVAVGGVIEVGSERGSGKGKKKLVGRYNLV